MKILVTGYLGYVGVEVTKILLERGIEVIGCDLGLYQDSILAREFLNSKLITHLNKDFRNLTESEIANVDSIIHLAAISNDPMGDIDKGLTMEINGDGTLQLAEFAKRAKIKSFIFASSCSIYGSLGSKPKTESDELNPLSEYAASKVFAEEKLKLLADDEFHAYLLRNSTACGASLNYRNDLVLNDLFSQFYFKRKAVIKSNGEPWRPLINVYDMARGLVLFALMDPVVLNGIPVNIGWNNQNVQVKEIGQLILNHFGEGELEIGNLIGNDPRDYKVDFSLLAEIFPNFLPKYPIHNSIIALEEMFKKYKILESDIEENKFTRINQIKSQLQKLR